VTCGTSGDRIIPHDLLAKEVHRSCRSALFTAQLEQRNLMEGAYRSGDIYIYVENWFNGRAAAFDISVTHPAALTYYKAAAKKDNAAATEREIGKFKKYEEAMALNPIPANFIFQPLVVYTFGSWFDAATQVLVRICK
jgi:hypothetical protein